MSKYAYREILQHMCGRCGTAFDYPPIVCNVCGSNADFEQQGFSQLALYAYETPAGDASCPICGGHDVHELGIDERVVCGDCGFQAQPFKLDE